MNVVMEVSIGEAIDKLTILEIKLEKISEAGKRENVLREHDALKGAISPDILQSLELSQLRRRLKDVNAELWRIEDDIRAKEREGAFDEEFVALARSVYIKNDQRAALKRDINLLANSDFIEEKSYAPY